MKQKQYSAAAPVKLSKTGLILFILALVVEFGGLIFFIACFAGRLMK